MDTMEDRNAKLLVDSLERFLVKIFGKEFIESEYNKLKTYAPRGKPEELRYLIAPNVHRAGKWYRLLETIKEQEYSFDLRFSTDVEEFMRLLLFAHGLDLLIRSNTLPLQRKEIVGALRDRGRFESLMYETMIASNYASNKFHVKFPELFGERVDIYAERGEIKVYVECKTLKKNEKYVDIAVEIGSWLNEKKVNVLLDITLPRTPKKEDVKKVSDLVKKVLEKGEACKEGDIKVSFTELPEYLCKPFQMSISNPENVEFILSSSYIRFSAKGPEVKEPKLIILRNPNKYEEVSRRLKDALEKADDQLKTVRGRKVIYIDASEVIGRPTLQIPELISLNTVMYSKLEAFVRSWLENHVTIDAVVMTEPRLYLDPFGIPCAVALESKTISSYIAPGWTILMNIIPMPKEASPKALVNMGIEMAKRGYYSLALGYYRKAIEIKPDLKEAYNNIGKLLTEAGRADEALKYLERALELDPKYAPALINKGIALAGLGKYTEALESFNEKLESR
ncbi:tetratricopeptide repeat protein [Candidatus Methanodesulfokora washburnensis]|jgi:tetratricopeptide (TPR) repeat protein|uniref:Tetratricopeptide repeat protein n=1 Tax=Candidatus Methanodesulfokora washburnensis TaxID=2478471 RepID=A0A3R9PYL8_9CREN|nr:tetratricopeptide repeat protein [Candidatus Methanodesulfokores washburnensis]RSN76452.1 tetratricopeptide repeat protein [Candidatus Methanodesulfokores washburnensis]